MTDAYDPQKDGFDSYNVAIAANRARLLRERCPAARRVEVIGGCELYLGDCMEIMPALEMVDVVVTDPPYAANTHKMAKTNKGAGHGRTLITFAALTDDQFDGAVRSCIGLSKGWVVMTCDYKHAARFYDAKEFVRLGAWVKPNPMPQISADRPGQGFETVLILHSGLTAKAWNRGGGSGVWTVPVTQGAEVATQKPMRLAQAFIDDFSNPGETIADPFMGSGTYGVACIKAGRRFVGIEVNETHFDIACARLRKAYSQPDMFVSATTAPKYVQEALL